jgi:ribosomal protein S18 acetylase RimI-like enzyme
VDIQYTINKANLEKVEEHLRACNADFIPPLATKVNIREYAVKVFSNAVRFEAWLGDTLIGLVAVYMNDAKKETAFITNVSVLSGYAGKGIASVMVRQSMDAASDQGFRRMTLEVSPDNSAAVALYKKAGFVTDKHDKSNLQTMSRYL